MKKFLIENMGLFLITVPPILLYMWEIIICLRNKVENQQYLKFKRLKDNPCIKIQFPLGVLLFSIIDEITHMNTLPYFIVIWIISLILLWSWRKNVFF